MRYFLSEPSKPSCSEEGGFWEEQFLDSELTRRWISTSNASEVNKHSDCYTEKVTNNMRMFYCFETVLTNDCSPLSMVGS